MVMTGPSVMIVYVPKRTHAGQAQKAQLDCRYVQKQSAHSPKLKLNNIRHMMLLVECLSNHLLGHVKLHMLVVDTGTYSTIHAARSAMSAVSFEIPGASAER